MGLQKSDNDQCWTAGDQVASLKHGGGVRNGKDGTDLGDGPVKPKD